MAGTARPDKVENRGGSFRAALEADIAVGDVGKVYAISINSSGRAVVGGPAETAISGLAVAVRPMKAREIIDVMTNGEIEDATMTSGAAFTLGAPVYAHADGTVDNTSASGKVVGITVARAGRLVVRVGAATT